MIVTDSNRVTTTAVTSEEKLAAEAAVMESLAAFSRNPPTAQADSSQTGGQPPALEKAKSPKTTKAEQLEAVPELEEPGIDLEQQVISPDDLKEETAVDAKTETEPEEEFIDFVDWANKHSKTKLKFKKGDEDIYIDAKKAAAIIGQGGAVSENARQLNIEKSKFEEERKELLDRQNQLLVAMEFTVQPRLEELGHELMKIDGFQQTITAQLKGSTDPEFIERCNQALAKNQMIADQHIKEIAKLRPRINSFLAQRKEEVAKQLETSRKAFKDENLKVKVVYDEVREKLQKAWPLANGETVPGIKNIDLICSDETLMAMCRDAMIYRGAKQGKQAGASVAQTVSKKVPNHTQMADTDKLAQLSKLASGKPSPAQADAAKQLVQYSLDAMRQRR